MTAPGRTLAWAITKPREQRCRSYRRTRGMFILHGVRCELKAGHDGPHVNWINAYFLDPRQCHRWGRG